MNKIVRLFYACTLVVALLLTACNTLPFAEPTPTSQPLVTLTASGAGTITTVLDVLASSFEASVAGYKLEVLDNTSTSIGITGILEGVLDVAAMSRAPKEDEVAKNIQYFEIGLVGQAIITHPSVTNVASLSKQQLIDIFSGKITNWYEVGGPNLELVLYVRDSNDSSTKGLRKAVIGEALFPGTATTLTSQEEMIVSVIGTPGAIGISGLPAVLAKKAKVQVVAIDGVQPNDPSYPILDSAGIGYLAERESDVQPLISWLSSTEGQSALKALGFVLSK